MVPLFLYISITELINGSELVFEVNLMVELGRCGNSSSIDLGGVLWSLI